MGCSRLTFISCRRSNKGFALAELVMVLGVLGMASLLIAALVSQVLKVGQRAGQQTAILELRGKVSVISKNQETWLNKMRTREVYAACIPQSDSIIFNSGNLKCPSVDVSDDIKDADTILSKMAGEQLHVVSAPIVDIFGEPLAGSEDTPVYFDSNGRLCDEAGANKKCLFKSVGYFLRTNPNSDQQPGNVKFIVKIQKNNEISANKSSGIFKPEYLSVDVGEMWKNPDQNSPTVKDENGNKKKVIKIGYRLDGEALYTSPGTSCSSGIMVGIGSDGTAKCESYPTGCSAGSEAIFDSASAKLICSSTNYCGTGQVFLGYIAGTGAPMCSSGNLSCNENEVQVGVNNNNGQQSAICKMLPSCEDSKILSYDGSEFLCMQDLAAKNCAADELMVGVKADGSLNCQKRTLASTNLSCPVGRFVSGIAADGTVTCAEVADPSQTRPEFRCPAGKSVVGFNADKSVICETQSSIIGTFAKTWNYAPNPIRARAPRGKSVTITVTKPVTILAHGYLSTVARDKDNDNLKIHKSSVRAVFKVNGQHCSSSDTAFASDRVFTFINEANCQTHLGPGTHTLSLERLVSVPAGAPRGYASVAGHFRTNQLVIRYILVDRENSQEIVNYQEIDVDGDGEE